jgi:hypothetical protein
VGAPHEGFAKAGRGQELVARAAWAGASVERPVDQASDVARSEVVGQAAPPHPRYPQTTALSEIPQRHVPPAVGSSGPAEMLSAGDADQTAGVDWRDVANPIGVDGRLRRAELGGRERERVTAGRALPCLVVLRRAQPLVNGGGEPRHLQPFHRPTKPEVSESAGRNLVVVFRREL